MLTVIKSPFEVDLFGVNAKIYGVSTDTDLSTINLRCDMQILDEATDELLYTLSSYYDSDSRAYFNISKLIDLGFDLPSAGTIVAHSVEECQNTSNKYKLRFLEYSGEDLSAPQIITSYIEKYAINGGLDPIRNRYYSFYDDYNNKRKFLTNQPREKLITRNQPEWIYYPTVKNPNGIASNRINVKMNFEDGSSESFYTNQFGFTSSVGDIHMIPSGFTQLDLEQYEDTDKLIISYEVKLEISSSFSETIIYNIDYSRQTWAKRYFIFRNSLGGMDVLCTRGKSTKTTRISRQASSHTEGLTPPISQHIQNNNNIISKPTDSVNFGWSTEEERAWIEELMIASHAWEIDLQRQIFIPIRITSSNLKINEDDNPLQDASFTFEYSEKKAV